MSVGCDDQKAVTGTRGRCAVGGAIGDCHDISSTVINACNKLVDCGAIPVDAADENGFDWGQCVDRIESRVSDIQSFVVACIAASSCDELRTDGSPGNPYGRIACLSYGER
jgi:hypothetical protein